MLICMYFTSMYEAGLLIHDQNMPMQIFSSFRDFFLFKHRLNIDCGYKSELERQGGSKE